MVARVLIAIATLLGCSPFCYCNTHIHPKLEFHLEVAVVTKSQKYLKRIPEMLYLMFLRKSNLQIYIIYRKISMNVFPLFQTFNMNGSRLAMTFSSTSSSKNIFNSLHVFIRWLCSFQMSCQIRKTICLKLVPFT